jgi:hypothetical protein
MLDVDALEPFELLPVLLASLLEHLRPDLRRERHFMPASFECDGQRRLRFAIHRRRVDEPAAGPDRR